LMLKTTRLRVGVLLPEVSQRCDGDDSHQTSLVPKWEPPSHRRTSSLSPRPKGIADKSPLVGRLVIDRMQAAEAGFWRGGRLYNPEDGRDYKGSLQLQSPERLVVDGCVLFICQTQVWRRADPGRCPPVAALSPQ
jgi:Uncharacterized protein conserved in bacteria (DUF2147)